MSDTFECANCQYNNAINYKNEAVCGRRASVVMSVSMADPTMNSDYAHEVFDTWSRDHHAGISVCSGRNELEDWR